MAKFSKKKVKEGIYDITTMVAGNFSLQEVLDKLAEAAVRITNVSACSIRLLDDSEKELKMRSTYGLSEAYRNKGPVVKDDAVIREAFKGNAIVIDDMRNDSRIKYPLASSREGLVSQLTVAMIFKDKPIGVLRLYSPKVKRFSEDEVAMARLVASQSAVAITNAKLYSAAIKGSQMYEQMRLAGIIQRRMLPQTAPNVPGLDISATYRPCFRVGGDLYDFVEINDHTVAVVIADVIGKGMPAAIMMSMFRGELRAFLKSASSCNVECVKDIVHKLNHEACRDCRDGEFITLFMAVINTDSMTLTYCNCGHEPTVMLRKGHLFDLEEGGLVLGIKEDAEYSVTTMTIQDQDSLVFYTDGLIDAINFEHNCWGRENMLNVLKKYNNWSAERTVKNLLRYRRRFVGLAPQVDDTSIVCVRVDKDANVDPNKVVEI